jgi:hypothetical protein
MKKLLLLVATVLLAAVTTTRATIVNWTYSGPNISITDGNAVGVFNSYTLATAGDLTSVQLSYTLSGGRAGDLIGYLILNNGGATYSTNVINRPGMDVTPVFGSSADSSSLDQSALNVTTSFGSGSLNLGANSTWTLYLADLATGGGTAELTGWGLSFDINTVPEPTTWALLATGALVGGAVLVRRVRRKTV